MRTLKDYLILSLKGIAMGAADVVPGVSGGTIAFITGIYEELLNTINAVNLDALKKLKTEGLKGFWQHINGNFIIALFLGIGISIASLAKLITYLMANQAVLLWSFFFGLIIASIYLVGKKIAKWNFSKIVGLLIGTSVAFYITLLPPMENPDALWYVFLSGAIAICAMILPGISGSFILLLLGSYQLILTSIKDLKLTIIAVFGAGCIVGFLSFSRLLSWMFKKYHDLTIAILTGFLVGSLNKIWPWKLTISNRTNSHGEVVPFIQENVLPADFIGEANIILSIVIAIVGLGLILILERFSAKD
ncbi:MAG: DUF368 domain-containing protein [Vicingaceae bacterium]|nr:DUF368 domain-containing protein [Vicingaceae bacterium]